MGKDILGILGLGALGRAMAVAATAAGSEVIAWSRSERSRQRDPATPGDVAVPATVRVVEDPLEVVDRARNVLFAIPNHAFLEVVDRVGGAARGDHHFVHATKGTDAHGLLMHEIIRNRTCVKQIGCLGGPLMAADAVKHGLAGVVAASRFNCVLNDLAALFCGRGSQLSRSHDLVGVEVAGALRNVISVASGMAEGMAETERSALLARGLVETARFGAALGASPETFVGLAGVGDLLVRREAHSSRNYRLGLRSAQGSDVPEDGDDARAPVEGAITARGVAERAASLGVRMPLVQGVVDVLDGRLSAREMVETLLATDPGLGAGDSLVPPQRLGSSRDAA